jgi:hypothetical protein
LESRFYRHLVTSAHGAAITFVSCRASSSIANYCSAPLDGVHRLDCNLLNTGA